jgi:hypothetical protein
MICDLHSSASRLQKSARRLKERWIETKELWDDPVSREFQEKVLEPIDQQVRLALAAIHQMAEVFHDAEQNCEDRDTFS